MIGTVATIVAVFVGVGVISGTVSSWRQGTAWPDMWRSARAWYITWLILIIIASVL
jgi:cytochrome bd-type quinol oxidase subunit 1|tara:strand:- start:2498 stop:2665 length:168 start_codon:yes stop_codon:yes gene_type:complete